MIFDIDGIESKIGYVFKDKMLLRKCFVHASYGYEHNEDNNELLEFFGDSVIEFVVTEYLFKNSAGDEGKLTEKRKELVSKEPLLKSIKKLGLAEYVLLGKGQGKNVHQDEKLFSSVYESLVAGIYLDGGIASAKSFINRTIIADFKGRELSKERNKKISDYKSAFQEYVQKRKMGSISYQTLGKTGPDHLPEYRVVALLNGGRIAEGKGSSKKFAEAEAASVALKKLISQAEEKKEKPKKTATSPKGKGKKVR